MRIKAALTGLLLLLGCLSSDPITFGAGGAGGDSEGGGGGGLGDAVPAGDGGPYGCGLYADSPVPVMCDGRPYIEKGRPADLPEKVFEIEAIQVER